MAVRYSLFHAVQCYELTKIEPIEDQIAQLYSDGTTSVRYNAENLYYTGYNYLVENKSRVPIIIALKMIIWCFCLLKQNSHKTVLISGQ